MNKYLTKQRIINRYNKGWREYRQFVEILTTDKNTMAYWIKRKMYTMIDTMIDKWI